VGPDSQLVPGRQPSPLDRFTVEDDPVEAAIVEQADPLARFVGEEGVTTGDAGIVEADVRLGAAPDPRPAFFDPECLDRAVALVEDQVSAGPRQ
jgi:hypothetical protein